MENCRLGDGAPGPWSTGHLQERGLPGRQVADLASAAWSWQTADKMRRCPGPHHLPLLDHFWMGGVGDAGVECPSADVPLGCSIEQMFP